MVLVEEGAAAPGLRLHCSNTVLTFEAPVEVLRDLSLEVCTVF